MVGSFGSHVHFIAPVRASIAKTVLHGPVAYRTPFETSGVVSSVPGVPSSVDHARVSPATVDELIWVSGL